MKKRHSHRPTTQQPTPPPASQPAERESKYTEAGDRMPSPQPAEETEAGQAGTGRMKTYATVALVLALLAISIILYRNNMQKDVWISTLQLEYSLGEKKRQNLEARIGEITDTINSVESKLQEIRSKQVSINGMISQSERGGLKKAKLLQDISVIESQLKKDRQDISDLQEKMNKANIRFKLLDEVIANLRMEIDKNEKSMAGLRAAIQERNRVIEGKNRVIAEKEEVIKSKEDSLNYAHENFRRVTDELEQTSQLLEETKNTAYYVVGGKKDLLKKNVLEETGGFLRKKLNIAPNFDNTVFTKVNIARENEISVNCRAEDVQLMPARAADSFTLEPSGKNACVLRVIDPEQFWKMPYLVILKKG